MQLGQAAGVMAALAHTESKKVRSVSIRRVQTKLLAAGCYIMPYLDLPKEHRHFKALQRIGATGILRGEGRNIGWANQTWFRADDPLLAAEIYTSDIYNAPLGIPAGPVKTSTIVGMLRGLGFHVPSDEQTWWEKMGLENYDPDRVVTRLEAAVVIDAVVDPFRMFSVNYNGNIRY
jgi:hypothetical protein